MTLVGVPGIGKSRLVHELFQIVEDDPEIITWRQGRCLAYGEGVTLWALGEIVKAQAGIHEQDAPEVAAAKIRGSVQAVLASSADAPWVESNLLALVGLGGESELGGDRRGQAFSAWRHYFEGMAEQRPLVLVVEDLHWADESLLDFLDELVDWVTDVPLLVVGTARPELLERRPGWGGGKLNATTLALRPLSDEQTALLLAQLLERPVLSAEDQQALLERAGGNPLYAEQFADLFLERGGTDELSLPETLQGIIAARLDGLGPAEKELLRDAAVVGKVFWVGSLSRRGDEAGATLHALERKGFVRRQRRSSVEDEDELAFAHALVRDVAYGQIARAERAEKHRRVATWIESLGRPEDHAEMLAYHWQSALDLVEASGGATTALVGHVQRVSVLAGDRAASLNAFVSAAAHYARSLALAPPEDVRVPDLLFKRAEALFNAGDESTWGALELAREALVEAGNTSTAAEAEALLARLSWLRGEHEQMSAHLRSAEILVEGGQPSLEVARVLAWSARQEMLTGDQEHALRRAEGALAMAERLDLVDLRLHALTTIGTAKVHLGDMNGRRDLELAIEIGRSVGSPTVTGSLINLAVVVDSIDFRLVEQLLREALDAAERLGDANLARFTRGNLLATSCFLGDWDECLREADAFIAECERGSPHVLESPTRLFRGYMRLSRGQGDAALDDFGKALELARGEPIAYLAPALIRNAWALLQLGRTADAQALFAEAVPLAEARSYGRLWMLPEVAFDLGETAVVRPILSRLPPTPATGRCSRSSTATSGGRAAVRRDRHRGPRGRVAFARGRAALFMRVEPARARLSSSERSRSTAPSERPCSSSAAKPSSARRRPPDVCLAARAQGRHGRLLRPRRLHRRAPSRWIPRTSRRSSSPTTSDSGRSSSAAAAPSRSSSATR